MLVINGAYDDAKHADEGHPERPARSRAALEGVEDLHLDSELVVVPARLATRAELVRAHDASYLDELSTFCYGGGGDLDADTYATYSSWVVAQHAAGAGLAVINELQERRDGVGFVVTRPPGHHALSDRAMGFCLLNNVAIAAAMLVEQGERVLVVDWDVHHGNGTQQIFWDEPNVLYVSTHEWPLFPGSGSAGEVGGPSALGTTLNVPLPAGATGDVLRHAFDEVITPVVERFEPSWVLVSAGYDAHRDDPLADLELTSGDYASLARRVAAFAPGPGRLAMFLEGGYELTALRESVTATLGTVLQAPTRHEEPSSGGPGHEHVTQARDAWLRSLEQRRRLVEEEGSE